MAAMKVVLYDGHNTIGGNKIYVQEGDTGVFLDFGHSFAKGGMYFQEFLRERSVRGINDFWKLNLIPRLNIYRKDLIPIDLSYEVRNAPRIPVSAVLITHAHTDHAGNVALLDENVCIVASPITIALLKASLDTGSNSNIGSEIPYYNPRAPKKDPAVLEVASSTYKSRKVIVTEKSEPVYEVLFRSYKKTKKIEENDVMELENMDLGFEIKAMPVSHSVPGAVGYIVEGDTAIAYTGDFRFHGRDGNLTKNFFRKVKELASVLIIEGTRVSREEDEYVSEEDVYNTIVGVMEESRNLVVITIPKRDLDRFQTILRATKRCGKELVLTPNHAFIYYTVGKVMGEDLLKNVEIMKKLASNSSTWEEIMLKELDKEPLHPFKIAKNLENYVLCLSYYDMKYLLDINPQGGTYIYSASEAYGEEDVFDFIRLWNWLKHFDFNVYGFEVVGENEVTFDKRFHASGHASGEEIVRVIDYVDPDYVIPVHTNSREWFVKEFGDIVVLDEEVRL